MQQSEIQTSTPIQWLRSQPFIREEEAWERWSDQNDSTSRSFDVHVTYGKELNTVSLKQKVVDDFQENVTRIRQENEKNFSSGSLEKVASCPICSEPSANNRLEAVFYGGKYFVCRRCDHRYVIERPTQQSLEEFYSENEAYQSTYADPKSLKERMDGVVIPKLKWVVEQFKRQYGREPKSILDVGAGSGHFVAAARDRSYQADGVELSQYGIEFARRNFGIELKKVDFIKDADSLSSYDVITFWGCIEHVPQPMQMLQVANVAGRQTKIKQRGNGCCRGAALDISKYGNSKDISKQSGKAPGSEFTHPQIRFANS